MGTKLHSPSFSCFRVLTYVPVQLRNSNFARWVLVLYANPANMMEGLGKTLIALICSVMKMDVGSSVVLGRFRFIKWN